ncbi:nif-specific regulatory protein [Burkholderiales bacterium GJ-E10]|nr:nif-specific regulatory protein [Burkholderiales bacterium GJ-E10]
MAEEAHRNADLEVATIYEIGKILSSSLDLPRTLREVLNLLGNRLGVRRGMLSLVQESGELHLVGAVGLSEAEIRRGRYRPGEGLTGRIFSSAMSCVVPNVAEEPMFLNRTGTVDEIGPDGDVAFIGVPIKVGQETLGVLSIIRAPDRRRRSFERDRRFLTMVANLIGQTVVLHRTVTADRLELLKERTRLQKQLTAAPRGKIVFDDVIGISPLMQKVFAEVHQAAPSRATVLLRGESGTGKEAIARAIHVQSARKDRPFVKVNCAALSETLLESELFGHEKGAFTGAHAERKGRFELADGGTLFLDEIGDISAAFQAKLLRVLQEQEFERVGGNRTIRVDVRLIAATNRDLEKAVAANQFRADLYYRINVVGIFLPPLRERREDIPALVEHFLAKFNKENRKDLKIAPEAMQVLRNCYWPGNVRELENCVERTATMARGALIREFDLPCVQNRCLTRALHVPEKPVAMPVGSAPAQAPEASPQNWEPSRIEGGERERLVWAMERCGWVQAKAARLLKLTPRQMGYALQKYQIEIKRI